MALPSNAVRSIVQRQRNDRLNPHKVARDWPERNANS
jgi:hypothetical protein